MQAWARIDPQERDRFFRAGLKASARLQPLRFRAWLLRRLRYPPLSRPADPASACFTITMADVTALRKADDANGGTRLSARRSAATSD
jgi:hypothetical protein